MPLPIDALNREFKHALRRLVIHEHQLLLRRVQIGTALRAFVERRDSKGCHAKRCKIVRRHKGWKASFRRDEKSARDPHHRRIWIADAHVPSTDGEVIYRERRSIDRRGLEDYGPRRGRRGLWRGRGFGVHIDEHCPRTTGERSDDTDSPTQFLEPVMLPVRLYLSFAPSGHCGKG